MPGREGAVIAVNCQDTERQIYRYINDNLQGDELACFLAHIDSCKSCREELEINYMVDIGIRELESDTGLYNIAGRLEKKLQESRTQVKRLNSLRVINWSLDTLAFLAGMLALAVQLRVWFY